VDFQKRSIAEHTHTQIAICNGALQLISVPAGKH
jgi:hypothetical protein